VAPGGEGYAESCERTSMHLIALALFVASTASTASTAPPGASYDEVLVKHYSPGLFRQVAANRGLLDDGARLGVDGYASNIYCWRIGQVVRARLQNPRTGQWGGVVRLLVVDCSQARDRQRHLSRGPQLEVDYATAARSGFAWNGRSGAGQTRGRVVGYEK
jgi:hypothetical protein